MTTFRQRAWHHRSQRPFFFDADEAETKKYFGRAVPPAYALYERGVYFTPAFAPFDAATESGFGPCCRAAMVLHESVHVVDRRSGEPAIHISEWDEPAILGADDRRVAAKPFSVRELRRPGVHRSDRLAPRVPLRGGSPRRVTRAGDMASRPSSAPISARLV